MSRARRRDPAPAQDRRAADRGTAGTHRRSPSRHSAGSARSSSARSSTIFSLAPPVLGLVVASPAVVGALSGTTDPVHAFGIVSVSLSAAWMLSALGARVAEAVPARARDAEPARGGTRRSEPARHEEEPAGPVALGRIEPVQVPASEAIPGTPGTPEANVSETEGPVA